jgi:hypothetical protein
MIVFPFSINNNRKTRKATTLSQRKHSSTHVLFFMFLSSCSSPHHRWRRTNRKESERHGNDARLVPVVHQVERAHPGHGEGRLRSPSAGMTSAPAPWSSSPRLISFFFGSSRGIMKRPSPSSTRRRRHLGLLWWLRSHRATVRAHGHCQKAGWGQPDGNVIHGWVRRVVPAARAPPRRVPAVSARLPRVHRL